ncbi:MAG TPA: NAD-dependent epimerase/dehydratase family protein [Bacteroidota bacterium]|nr:NAD-dependent epimerase/dehydratase family protein [Bacteroidota bacterium]
MKTLVTGGTGFIGSHLVERLLEKGESVICVAKDVMHARMLALRGCDAMLADINEADGLDSALDGVDTVYHVAGLTRCRRPEDYYEANTRGTRRFLEVCRGHRGTIRRFIYVSSQTAVGPSLDGRPVSEESPYHPVSHYGRSKMLAEMEVLRAARALPVTIVRPSAVYGPRERDMYDYIKTVKRGLKLLIGFHDKLMSLVHVDDLVSGILLAGESVRAAGKKYFLGSERPYSIREIGGTIATVLHRHPLCVRLPHSLVYAVGAAATAIGKATGAEVFFNMEKAREAVQPAWTCSVAKAATELGYRERFTLEEGMRQTYAWYVENGWL